jgi:hypothetical protein
MDDFLAKTLEDLNAESPALPGLSDSFIRSMFNNYIIFGRDAFRRSISADRRRSIINVALFDVLSVELAQLSSQDAAEKKESIRLATLQLLDAPSFREAITRSTNSASNVRTRFAMFREAIKPFLP